MMKVRIAFPLALLAIELAGIVARKPTILVVGSANVDTFFPVERLPLEGENVALLEGQYPSQDYPGGKGCTQAVAAAKLTQGSVSFIGRFGNDSAGELLRRTLRQADVDLSHCESSNDVPSGRGYVFLSQSGSVSAVISGGNNMEGWKSWKRIWESTMAGDTGASQLPLDWQNPIDELLTDVDCVLLQREVPEYVNCLIASRAKLQSRPILVFQDLGGEDRPISYEMLRLCDYIVPNESELLRAVERIQDYTMETAPLTDDRVEQLAKLLQTHGARNVLVTRGSRGSTLVTEDGQTIHQPAIRMDRKAVVDETGAGDCYRAAFGVALVEGYSLRESLHFASAAGSCSVEVKGACNSTPPRAKVNKRLDQATMNIPHGGNQESEKDRDKDFPFLIGSRLNSMKDRSELWGKPLQTPLETLERQATISGLTCVDFNYPQHFEGFWKVEDAKAALDRHGLQAGAVCLRYPRKFARGAMNNPDPKLREEAIKITEDAARAAQTLGCDEVVVWSAYDGYDYPLQVDYDRTWDQLVHAFQRLCDEFPDIRFSLEFKPTDENTRFFTVPSTAAALLLIDEIDRPNMGLTLDVGHMLMAGENPGHSIAQVARKKRLFGIQLNDGFTRLAAEDGLMFGSVHPSVALEIMYQLQRTGFNGHFYFDTFPQRTDPVKEAEYNIQRVKRFWSAAQAMTEKEVREVADAHDAIGALMLVENALKESF